MKIALSSSVIALCATAAFADCSEVSFSDVGWTDITTTTTIAKQLLEPLGYDVNVSVLSVPVTFASLSGGDTDIFLGNWMPAQSGAVTPYLEDGSIESVHENLQGTVYTLAVPAYTYEKGLKDFADIAKFADALDETIYGIEPGNEGNDYLIGLTEANTHGLGEFKVKESSEQGMLSQVRRAYDKNEDVVFLGWAPHPMNVEFDLKYLTGGEEFFGGVGVVNTLTRKGFVEDCPNVGKLLDNLDFTVGMESEIMGAILTDGEDADDAVKAYVTAHPDLLAGWLEGVTTLDGGEALAAVKASYGL
ncbi:choline ABC transporter substrate-binding protein [Celeribacter neptunius]|uniref:Glycine betaine/proline transport system substrate-binding protein n=1 Tax=Celeribacter neptunius TaxID=588602 RepID=A0A1I3R2L5_9RHOB|nr:choline ABC transporter substrate-binding protein [Celeribacter neptunius]SFJ39939.1 glycine betaine/proline transport system substrate-binding protein [Celeribacter neptunius]